MEFELNQEKIDELTKGHKKKELGFNCKIKDDKTIIALLIKYHKIEYKCCIKGCEVGNSWNKKSIKLLLSRKNNKETDCRLSNLELICYNCYFQKNEYDCDLFKKIKKKNILECKVCYFTLNKMPKMYKEMKLCKICYEKYYKKRVKIRNNDSDEDSDSDTDTEQNIQVVNTNTNTNLNRNKSKDEDNSIRESINNLTFDNDELENIRKNLKENNLI